MQLPLALQLQDSATFANFSVGYNQLLVTTLRESACNQNEKQIFFYGADGTGKTHLLQACCHAAQEKDNRTVYLPLTNTSLSPQILEGLETLDLICLDDLQAIMGNEAWEEALFHCYNRLLNRNTRLIISANLPLKNLAVKLPDLASRLSAGVVFQLQPLTDEQKITAMQLRAKAKGLLLHTDVGQYLLRRCPRDMTALFNLLDKLDQASLAAQRRLTVPFVKKIIGDSTTDVIDD